MQMQTCILAWGHVLMASYKYNCQNCPKQRSMLASHKGPVHGQSPLVEAGVMARCENLHSAEDQQLLSQPEGPHWWSCMFQTINLQSNIASFGLATAEIYQNSHVWWSNLQETFSISREKNILLRPLQTPLLILAINQTVFLCHTLVNNNN